MALNRYQRRIFDIVKQPKSDDQQEDLSEALTALLSKSNPEYQKGVNIRDNDGEIPITIAAGSGNPEITKLLIDSHADVNAKTGQRGCTALMLSALHISEKTVNDHVKIAQDLLEAKASVDMQRDCDGGTALMLAIEASNFSAPFIALLLKYSPDLSIQNKYNNTAEYYAKYFRWKSAETYQMLLRNHSASSASTISTENIEPAKSPKMK